MGYGMYEEFISITSYICNGLFSIGEYGFSTRRMICLCNLLRRRQDSSNKFSSIRTHSYTPNPDSKADSLARSGRKQSSFLVHMDAELPSWFAES